LARARVLLLLAATAIALVAAGAARADGDPASDVLYTERVFFPYGSPVSGAQRKALTARVVAAEKAGYQIRVALIAAPLDLGAVTSLWRKPRQYASFLDVELSFVYKGPLLIVMPAGLGFAHYKHRTDSEYRALAGIRVAKGGDGLAATAIEAVEALAARAGHPITGPGASSSGSSGLSDVLLGVIAFAALVVATGGVVLVRRRRDGPTR
jgi:hypothetical protein